MRITLNSQMIHYALKNIDDVRSYASLHNLVIEEVGFLVRLFRGDRSVETWVATLRAVGGEKWSVTTAKKTDLPKALIVLDKQVRCNFRLKWGITTNSAGLDALIAEATSFERKVQYT